MYFKQIVNVRSDKYKSAGHNLLTLTTAGLNDLHTPYCCLSGGFVVTADDEPHPFRSDKAKM